MTDLQIINEDERRKLTAFPEGKLLEIKEDCIVGKHYHKIKTEVFILAKGEARMIKKNDTGNVIHNHSISIGEIIHVYPNEYHEFHLTKGSILVGFCSHPYDKTDDYHL